MKNNIFKVLMIYSFVVWTASLGLGDQNSTDNEGLCSYKIPRSTFKSYKALADTIRFPEIQENNLYRLGTTVDETILDNIEKVTRKSTALGQGYFTDKRWIGGTSGFNAIIVVNNSNPLPTELPAERRKYILDKCREWGKSDLETEEYLAIKLESYRKSLKNVVKGQLSVRIVNAPSAKAAFEFLLVDAGKSNMVTGAIAAGFDEKYKIHGLGTLSYNQGDCVRFIRDNIAVVISANGEFKDQAVDIAKKIDAMLLKQSLLTYDQLQARCPQVTFTHKRHKVDRPSDSKPDDIFCDISVPSGINYVIPETKIEGTDGTLGILDGRKHLYYDDRREDKTKPLRVEMTVVTDELLVTRVSRDLEVSNSDKGEYQEP